MRKINKITAINNMLKAENLKISYFYKFMHNF